MLVGPQIGEDDLTEARVDSTTLSCSLQHNLPHTLRGVLSDHRHSNLTVDHLATVSLVVRDPSEAVFFKLIRVTLPPHRRENSDQHHVEPTANGPSDAMPRVQHASALLGQEPALGLCTTQPGDSAHSLVLQGNIWLLSVNVEACLVVSRQDRLPQHLFKTRKTARCLEGEAPLCKVRLVAVKDRNLLHDVSIHDRTKLREVLTNPDAWRAWACWACCCCT